MGYKGYDVLIYGSAVNSTFKDSNVSDIDITIVIDNFITCHKKLLYDVKTIL